MDPVRATFTIVKVQEDQWDVLIFAEEAVLKGFVDTYPNLFYVAESVFDKTPMVVAPDFPNQNHAKIWKEYWEIAFKDPNKSCRSCPTVQELFQRIDARRNVSDDSPQGLDSAG